MTNPTYFIQECPTCGRRLQIRVEYLGKKLVCQHCQGQMIATDPTNLRCGSGESGNALLHRANELLDTVARRNSSTAFMPAVRAK